MEPEVAHRLPAALTTEREAWGGMPHGGACAQDDRQARVRPTSDGRARQNNESKQFACSGVLSKEPFMQKQTILAALAQNRGDMRSSQSSAAPANPTAGDGRAAPVAEINPSAAGGKAAATAQTRVNARLMDSNGDGMVSRKEWDTYHANAWNTLQPTNTGVSTADIDKLNRTPMTH